MKDQYLLGLDLGGSSGKAMVFDTQNHEFSLSSCQWQLPAAPEAGAYAFNLGWEERWQELCAIAKDALQKSGAQPSEVAAISVTSMRHGMVLIDKDGQTILALPNKDARAITESMDLQGERGEEVYQISGHMPSPVLLAPRLVYLKEQQPDLLARTDKVLTISDWMAFMLTGRPVSEPTQAGETCLFDLANNDWSWALIKSLGLPESIFPALVKPGDQVGTLTANAAQQLGLIEGIPVAAGGADTQLGLLALGITQSDEVGIIAGSTTPVMVTTNTPLFDPGRRTWTGMHAIPGIYVVESNAGGMGNTLEWIAGLLYADLPDPVAALGGDASASSSGAGGVLSTMGSQIFNASALGMPVDGFTFSSMAVPTGAAGRSRFARAVLEGMAFSVKANAEQSLQVAGIHARRVHAGGGMMRSQLFRSLLANVFNLPLSYGEGQHTSVFGAIICAAVGAGKFSDLISAASAMTSRMNSIEPEEMAGVYTDLYKTWYAHLQKRAEADAIATDSIMQAMQEAAELEGQTPDINFRPHIYVSANAGQEAISMLEKLGKVTYASYSESGTLLEGDEMVETLAGYQVLVTEVDMVSADVLQKASDLRVVVVCRGNPVNVDIAACTAAGVPVINTPGRNADAVADLAVSFMLMLVRKLDKASSFLRQPGGEAGDMGRMGQAYFTLKANELWHKTIGIVGGGAIGKKVIKRLLPFETKCLLYDPFVTEEEAALIGAKKVSLAELLTQSDIISLHAPVNDETTGMIGSQALTQMKNGAYLVNTARAALVDHDAMLIALQQGKLGGVALDVFPVEPPGSDDPLLALDNVIATPHIGGNTNEVGIHQGAIIVDELTRLLQGQRPQFILNPESLSGFRWTGQRQADLKTLEQRAKGPGPGMTDLDLKARQEAAESNEEPKAGGILGGLKRLLGGREKEDQVLVESIQPVPVASGKGASEGEKKYSAILERFLEKLAIDDSARAFAKSNKVSFQFILKNTAIQFFMGFADGNIRSGMGEAPFKPDVTVKMDADTFDGMFTGRVDGRKAFSDGKLSVAGNMLKAMAMQKLDFGPLYAATRDEMGGVGDLTSLGKPVEVNVPAVASAAPKATAEVSPGAATGGAANFELFNRVLARYVEIMQADEATRAFAKGKNVTFLYILKDAGSQFYTSFVEGNVACGMGEAPMKVDVTIKTDAATLDGMFSGRLDGTAAFKSGKLSVGGNMMKAMVMQKLNFGSIYKQALSEIGTPDLLGNPTPVEVAASKTPLNTVSTTTPSFSVPPQIHKVGDIRDTILEVNNELYAKGLITFTGGNISARTDDNPNELWITPSAINKATLRADMMVRIDLDGNVIGDANYNASSERRVHCAVFREKPAVKAVVHSHAVYATLMALTGTRWLPVSADACFFGEIGVTPFIMPGSHELGDEVVKAMGATGFAAIMQNHGLVVAGSSLRSAADMTEMIEVVAHKLIVCRQLGIDPITIPGDIATMLAEMGSAVA